MIILGVLLLSSANSVTMDDNLKLAKEIRQQAESMEWVPAGTVPKNEMVMRIRKISKEKK
jgi:hypothetical protein